MSRSKQGSRLSETFVNGSAVALLAFLFLLNLTQVARLVTNLLQKYFLSIHKRRSGTQADKNTGPNVLTGCFPFNNSITSQVC